MAITWTQVAAFAAKVIAFIEKYGPTALTLLAELLPLLAKVYDAATPASKQAAKDAVAAKIAEM